MTGRPAEGQEGGRPATRWLRRIRAVVRMVTAFVAACTVEVVALLLLYGVLRLDPADVAQDVAPNGSALRGFGSAVLLLTPAIVGAWALHRRWTEPR